MAVAGHTLHSRASGGRMTFRTTAADSDGELVAIHHELPPRACVPGGLHVHPLQEERFEVVPRTVHFRLGRKRLTAGPGEEVVVPALVRHDLANAADTLALMGAAHR